MPTRHDLTRQLEDLLEAGEVTAEQYAEGLELLSEIHDAEERCAREGWFS